MVNGKFVDESPVNGTPGSLIPSSWGNAVTDEILSVIRSTNAVPTESNNAQLTDAIVSIADLRASQAVSKAVSQSTENASGVAKIATQVQTNLGVDDTTIVTPKKMAGAVQGQALVAFTTTGAAPQFALAPVPAASAYTVNQRFQVSFNAAGGAAPTLNISGLGVKNLKQYNSFGGKVAAIIVSGQVSDVVYDGTDFVVLDALPNLTGITSAQFDNSANLATAAFVNRVGVQFSTIRSIVLSATTVTLTAADAGSLVNVTGSGGGILVLPLASTVPSGAAITVRASNTSVSANTISSQGANTISGLLAADATNPLVMRSGDSAVFVSDGVSGWIVSADTTYNAAIAQMSNYFTASQLKAWNGYQTLPGGYIIQKGLLLCTSANTFYTFTFPKAFPSSAGSTTILISPTNGSLSGSIIAYPTTPTGTSVQVLCNTGGAYIQILAIGY
nr:hypothetical protein [Pseudomonas gingeri]